MFGFVSQLLVMRNPEIAKKPSTPTEKSTCRIASGGIRPVTGNECHKITSAASASRKAFSALFRGSNACANFIYSAPSSPPGAASQSYRCLSNDRVPLRRPEWVGS